MTVKQAITNHVMRYAAWFTYCKPAGPMRGQWLTYRLLRPFLKWKDKDWNQGCPAESSDIEDGSTIWIYWAQGINNAPKMVKKCIKSIGKHSGKRKVIILDRNNLNKFVNMPEHILRKYDKGIIQQAQFSDLLRISLLITHGGIWCDATCFMTSDIPSYIDDSDLFMFTRTMLPDHIGPCVSSNWFILAKKNNILLIKLRNFLFEYWKHYDVMINYFVFHIVLGMLVRNDQECRRVFYGKPYICNAQPHILQFSFGRVYDEALWQHIIGSCFVHKLNYKFDKALLNSNKENILQHFMKVAD